jgi:hypothetical protein
MLTVPFIKEVIIWNNNSDLQLKFANCKVINSSHNFMPFARYGCAILATQNTILFQDDDLLLTRRNIELAYNEYLKDRSRIYGTEGRNLKNGKYNIGSVFGECDIVLGQFMMFDKKLLATVFQHIMNLTPIDRGDDIAFSLLCETKPRALRLDYQNLGMEDEHALYRQTDHLKKRQVMVDRVFEIKNRISGNLQGAGANGSVECHKRLRSDPAPPDGSGLFRFFSKSLWK